jgi:hypothetical protein
MALSQLAFCSDQKEQRPMVITSHCILPGDARCQIKRSCHHRLGVPNRSARTCSGGLEPRQNENNAYMVALCPTADSRPLVTITSYEYTSYDVRGNRGCVLLLLSAYLCLYQKNAADHEDNVLQGCKPTSRILHTAFVGCKRD